MVCCRISLRTISAVLAKYIASLSAQAEAKTGPTSFSKAINTFLHLLKAFSSGILASSLSFSLDVLNEISSIPNCLRLHSNKLLRSASLNTHPPGLFL